MHKQSTYIRTHTHRAGACPSSHVTTESTCVVEAMYVHAAHHMPTTTLCADRAPQNKTSTLSPRPRPAIPPATHTYIQTTRHSCRVLHVAGYMTRASGALSGTTASRGWLFWTPRRDAPSTKIESTTCYLGGTRTAGRAAATTWFLSTRADAWCVAE